MFLILTTNIIITLNNIIIIIIYFEANNEARELTQDDGVDMTEENGPQGSF